MAEQFDNDLRAEARKLEAVNQQREKLNKLLSAEKWVSKLRKYKTGKHLKQEAVDAFIRKITVYPDKTVEIEWNYRDKEAELLEILNGGDSLA